MDNKNRVCSGRLY